MLHNSTCYCFFSTVMIDCYNVAFSMKFQDGESHYPMQFPGNIGPKVCNIISKYVVIIFFYSFFESEISIIFFK